MMESDEQTAQRHMRYKHLHSAIVRQMLHLHVPGRPSMSVRRSHGAGRLQHILGSREGEIALSSGLVSFLISLLDLALFGHLLFIAHIGLCVLLTSLQAMIGSDLEVFLFLFV